MVTVTAYYDGLAFIPNEKMFFQKGQQAIVVINNLSENHSKTICRGLASKYANVSLVHKEAEIISDAFNGK